MKSASFVIFLTVALVLTAGVLAAILIYFDPFSSQGIVFVLFYTAFFLFLAGFFSLILFLLKRITLSKKPDWQFISGSVRQGFLLAILGNGILCLQRQQMLAWWSLFVIVGILMVTELFFKFRKSE